MSLGIHFTEDIASRLAALALANARAMEWARQFGADRRDIAIAEAAYQAALADTGVSFGLERPELLVVFRRREPDHQLGKVPARATEREIAEAEQEPEGAKQ